MTAAPRYLIAVGGLWAFEIVGFAVIYQVVGVTAAIVIMRVVGAGAALALHKWFTFKGRGRLSAREIFGYFALWAAKVGLLVAGVNATLASLGGDPVIVKAAMDVVVFAASFFILSRIFKPA